MPSMPVSEQISVLATVAKMRSLGKRGVAGSTLPVFAVPATIRPRFCAPSADPGQGRRVDEHGSRCCRHAVEPLRAAPLCAGDHSTRKPGAGPTGQTARRRVLPRGRLPVRVPRQRDRLGHGQGGAGGPEDHGHAGLDRHAQPFSASGRSGPRRPGPRPPRRRDADPLAERRDRGGRAPAALAGRVGRADRGDHRAGRQHAGPRGHGGPRTRPAGRGLPAAAGAQHQHHGHAGGGRRAGAGRQPDAELRPRGFRPLPSGRQRWG